MKPVRAFWWSPARSPQLLGPELIGNPALWARLAVQNGRPLKNFGDELTKHVLEYATGRRVRWSTPEESDVVAIGSVLELCLRRQGSAAIWGTGLRGEISAERLETFSAHGGPILAVRGPDTRAQLGLGDDVPLGDPGLLASALIDGTRIARHSRVSFIPHFRAWKTAAGRTEIRVAKESGIDVILPTAHPIDVVKQVAESRFLLSSSLHGVVVAHSVGTPCQLLSLPGSDVEPDFKYEDYLNSVGAAFRPVSFARAERELEVMFELRESESGALKARADALGERLMDSISTI